MKYFTANTFQKALTRLSAPEQKAVKITVFDLQNDPAHPGLRFHRIERSQDPDFWSVRVNRDIRLIVHKTASGILLCYVDHHDDAYDWARRRRIEAHPATGAMQIVEVRELVEEIPPPVAAPGFSGAGAQAGAQAGAGAQQARPFAGLDEGALLRLGVPQGWIADIRQADEDGFLDLAGHLPEEAAEALLEFIATGQLPQPQAPAPGGTPFEHPDARRRFRVMEGVEELRAALEYPWEQWAVFLHPSQRRIVESAFSGPARVTGSAGTGKTMVALHRAASLLRRQPHKARILLTTFSSPLANALKHKLKVLLAGDAGRITVLPFREVARELFMLAHGHAPRPARPEHVRAALEQARGEAGVEDFPLRFFVSEWEAVIDAWRIVGLEDYARVPRIGRRNRLGARQRERIWPVFERARGILAANGFMTWPEICADAAAHYAGRADKPFTHIIADEAQDLGVAELRMFAAIAGRGPDALFFAGDTGQQIFQEPFSWKALGIDIRGRSHVLKVNYRTSHQIRRSAGRLLPDEVHDADGNVEDRRGAVSLFNGPEPQVLAFDSAGEEQKGVARWIAARLEEGVEAHEIGLFVRSGKELPRAREALRRAGVEACELSPRMEGERGNVAVGVMHLAKGLEFRAVAVMACDEDVLPQMARLEAAADEAELDHAYEMERRLFYVACTRAREQLMVSGVTPASEFFEDLAKNLQAPSAYFS